MPNQVEEETFPIFFTEEELTEMLNRGQSINVWHKLNNALNIVRNGAPCCDAMVIQLP